MRFLRPQMCKSVIVSIVNCTIAHGIGSLALYMWEYFYINESLYLSKLCTLISWVWVSMLAMLATYFGHSPKPMTIDWGKCWNVDQLVDLELRPLVWLTIHQSCSVQSLYYCWCCINLTSHLLGPQSRATIPFEHLIRVPPKVLRKSKSNILHRYSASLRGYFSSLVL